ncbi:MAG: TIGR02466 family protein [Pseudomonadota bacterium]
MADRLLFPTLLHHVALSDGALLAELEASVWMVEDGDRAGHAWSEGEGYPGYTSYASLDDLPVRAPAFAALVERLDQEAAAFAAALGWDLSGQSLALENMWINILAPGGMHSGHIHPGNVISGTIYVAMPEGAGGLKLEDPRLPLMMAAPQLAEGADERLRRFVYIDPEPGDILMWESWLRHEVMAHQGEDPRVSISFNYGLAAGVRDLHP